MECQYGGGRTVRSKYQLIESYAIVALTVSQATVAVSGKAKDLAATISSGKSAKDEREEYAKQLRVLFDEKADLSTEEETHS